MHLIMLNLDIIGANEDLRNNPKVFENNKEVADVIQMNKIQMSLNLQELHTLIILLAPDIDPTMITILIKFQKESMDNILQTGILRAPLPWSTIIIGIDRIIKKYFLPSIGEFKIKELKNLIAEEYKNELKQGRTSLENS